jgi:pimeloyl-ACP methyl ester carboxylesterase
MFMHPRTMQTRPYLAPYLLEAGISVWGQAGRDVNNDTDMSHEEILLDVAAGMRMLRAKGFERIVLIGNSGGGSLLGSYQWQASLAPGERLTCSPAGEQTHFAAEEMPTADLFVALAAHPGEGLVLLGALDPAIVDERDPTVVDPRLDMFSAENGYRTFPEPSRYELDWLCDYREAQRDRCRRLDVLARGLLESRRAAIAASAPLGSAENRRGLLAPYMVIYGTLANPAYLDTSISPNERPVGSLFAGRSNPLGGSLGPAGLGRVVTPRAWLGGWSGLSARLMLINAIEHIDLPTLFVYAEGDTEVFPDDQSVMFERSPATDKSYESIGGAEHYLTRVPGSEGEDPRAIAGRIVCEWLDERLD